MNEVITLDENYSTTRRVIKVDQQNIADLVKQKNKPEHKFETVLFLPQSEVPQGEGGLRTKGFFKKSHNEKPLVTIITVVFNGENDIEDTIVSVINQTYENIEYIIIDGGSSDGTLDIIKKYNDAIDYWISEPDRGIYDAMNKGLDFTSGDWVNFMNAGDKFFNFSVLSDIFDNEIHNKAQILYGNHQVIYQDGKIRNSEGGKIVNLWKGSQFSHQATFIDCNYHRAHKFNLCTKIVADYEFFFIAFKKDILFKHLDITVAKFEAEGVSDIKRIDSILGRWIIIDKSFRTNIYYCYLILVENIKKVIKNFFF